ncbi:hypothetical protein [Xanthomonas phage RTH11]|nr:hypothetical protein [Xanthomonas phage RTH11]
MRLIDQRPISHQQPFPLMVMALGDLQQGDVCHHYRVARNYGDHMTVGGPEIVLCSGAVEGGTHDGLTLDSVLAICEDYAKTQSHGSPSMRMVTSQLQAARRLLAADESSGPHPTHTGGDSSLAN